jgi:hypothetical protein
MRDHFIRKPRGGRASFRVFESRVKDRHTLTKEGRKMKKSLLSLVVLALVVVPMTAWGSGAVEGTVQGFNCVMQGKVCPVGQEDPMAAVEDVFVVFTKDGKYFFVPNLDRAVMARHINQMVKVSGAVSDKFPSITADKLEVMDKGAWKTAWSKEMEREIGGKYGM